MDCDGPRPKTMEDDRTRRRPTLYSAHAPAVFAVCLANTRNYHDAEDLTQAVFATAIAKISSLRDPGRARAWLLQAARRQCIDFHRRQKPAEPLWDTPQISPSGETLLVERLHAAMQKLPQPYREAIALYYLDGHNCASVAACLGASEAAIRQRSGARASHAS